jgi:1,2-diacylglycerol-3-alpha-glucose alpha-1,2-galactosyltransferase
MNTLINDKREERKNRIESILIFIQRIMKIHVISETPFIMKATGVHTAFMDHIELLKEKDDVEVIVNDEGYGEISHGHTYGLYYLWKARKNKGRRVFTAHVIPDSIIGSLPAWWLFMPFIRLGLRIVYSYADVCIAISPMVRQAIIDSGANTRIVSIYNPINIKTWKRTLQNRERGRLLLGLEEKDFVVLGVGQLIGRKGVDDFLDIAEAIPEVKFVWAGGRPFGGLTEGIKRIDDGFTNSGKNVVNAGPIDLEDMPLIYAAADLMLFPSFQENCPLAPIEAAACGMPVIFRDIQEYKSLYENRYLSAGSTEEFISMTRKMINEKEYYNEGLNISEQLLRQFDKDIIRKKLIDTYQSLLDSYVEYNLMDAPVSYI